MMTMTMMTTTIMTMMITIMTMFKMRITTMMMMTMATMMMIMRRGEEWIAQKHQKAEKESKNKHNNNKKAQCKPVKCQAKCARSFLLASVTGR